MNRYCKEMKFRVSKPRSTDAFIANHVQHAEVCLKDHVIIRHHEWFDGHGIVTIGKANGSSMYRCDFALMPMGYLVMTGDSDTLCWGGFYGKSVRAAIAWMASRDSPADHYFAEKARIGMNASPGRMDVSDVDDEVAMYDAIQQKKEAYPDLQEEWSEIIRYIVVEGAHSGDPDWYQMLTTVDEDYEIGEWLGKVPSFRMMWGWSMLRKADALLEATERASCPSNAA